MLTTTLQQERHQRNGQFSTLAEDVQAGEHATFEALFARYEQAIFTFCYRMMEDRQDAHDMTQDTFLKAYLALGLGQYRDEQKVDAWLYRIATNVCRDELRHRRLVQWVDIVKAFPMFVASHDKVNPQPSELSRQHGHKLTEGNAEVLPEAAVLHQELRGQVGAALERIPHKQRVVLSLREHHGLSYDEIAEVLDTTRGAVKSLLFRARQEVRAVWPSVAPQGPC